MVSLFERQAFNNESISRGNCEESVDGNSVTTYQALFLIAAPYLQLLNHTLANLPISKDVQIKRTRNGRKSRTKKARSIQKSNENAARHPKCLPMNQ